MASIQEAMLAEAPPWLKEGDGAKFLMVMGTMLQAQVEWTKQGMRARYPSYLTDDALAAIGRDRQIVRGAFEPSESYAERLRRWLDDWLLAGNPFAILRQLRAYLLPFEVPMRIVNHAGCWYTLNPDGSAEWLLKQGNWDWDSNKDWGETTPWSRFWVILYPPAELWTQSLEWDDPDETELWGETEYTWGSNATVDQVTSVRRIVSMFKDEKSRCENIIVSFDADLFEPTDPVGAPNPDGNWHNWSVNVGGVQVPARNPNAIYWEGV